MPCLTDTAPAQLAIPTTEARKVEVHLVDLDRLASELDDVPAELSADESERAASFATRVLALRFAAGRMVLRRVLARVCGTSASQIAFSYGPHGKPFLEPVTKGPWFNLSHTGAIAALAVSHSDEIGIDIEELDNTNVCDEIAEMILSPGEGQGLRALEDEHDRRLQILRCWTAKEAYLKLTGTGLLRDPRSILVDWANAGEGAIRNADDHRCLAFVRTIDTGAATLCCIASSRPLARADILLSTISTHQMVPGTI